MTVESFSGTHPYRPQCLLARLVLELETELGRARTQSKLDRALDHVQSLTRSIDRGMCPRCLRALRPLPGHIPAGSRITQCRCIPVCPECGEHEAIDYAYYSLWDWPLDDPDVVEIEIEEIRAQCKRVILDPGDFSEPGGRLVRDGDSGGWSSRGYDDALDEVERRG